MELLEVQKQNKPEFTITKIMYTLAICEQKLYFD
jgi:hypothetical protein